MLIGVYRKASPEPVFSTINEKNLLKGKNIKEALQIMNITEKNFSHGSISVTDAETGLKLSYNFDNYETFLEYMWYIRQKMLKKKER
ncbi:hypothetical protein DRN58_06575 [Thermococci archaeon]|nr:MAG: hypothetical protein DRN58_06575 [Thermococci archaeon]